MGNVYKDPGKHPMRKRLFEIGVEALQKLGYSVERVPRSGRASLRRITKGGKSLLVAIRTSQDTWIAFPPKADGSGWTTLDDVDVVLAVSVDNRESPREALVHWVDGKEMRTRF